MNNTGVTGLKDFEHARGPRNSAYALNLTYDRHTTNDIPKTYTRKMVPITGRARSFLLVFKNKIEKGDRIKTTGLSIYPML